jgi:hypothetical protein
LNGRIQLERFGREGRPIDAGPPVRCNHPGELVERKTGRLAQGDEGEALENRRSEQAP